jgi:hypothetical protein
MDRPLVGRYSRLTRRQEADVTGLNGNARTAETYLAGLGATGALVAGMVVVFLLLVGMVTFDAWPSPSSLFGGDEADVEVAGTNGPADAAAAALDDAAGLVASARPGDSLVSAPGDAGGTTGTGTGPGGDGGGVGGPGGGDGQAPVGGTPGGTGAAGGGRVQETVDTTVDGVGQAVDDTVSGLGTTVQTTVDGLGKTVNDTLKGVGTLVTGITGGEKK